jgi:hypothetical protein
MFFWVGIESLGEGRCSTGYESYVLGRLLEGLWKPRLNWDDVAG